MYDTPRAPGHSPERLRSRLLPQVPAALPICPCSSLGSLRPRSPEQNPGQRPLQQEASRLHAHLVNLVLFLQADDALAPATHHYLPRQQGLEGQGRGQKRLLATSQAAFAARETVRREPEPGAWRGLCSIFCDPDTLFWTPASLSGIPASLSVQRGAKPRGLKLLLLTPTDPESRHTSDPPTSSMA